ncbi:hypothetical protein [Amycolatopsis japonica]|nr:hypothetical protein [Amycolatopsis japonica]
MTGKEYEADESCWEIELDTGYELCLSKEEFKTYDIGDYYPKGE